MSKFAFVVTDIGDCLRNCQEFNMNVPTNTTHGTANSRTNSPNKKIAIMVFVIYVSIVVLT